MLKNTLRASTAALAVAALALATAPAAADEGEERIRIHKVHHDCEGEDCSHDGEHHAFFIGEGGEMMALGDDEIAWMAMGGSGTFLGVQLTELTDELRAHFGAPEGRGVMVAKVVDGSPAAIAGVRVGDVITAVDSEAVKSGGTLGRLIGQRDEGETVALELYRDGRIETLSPTLARREPQRMARRMRMHGPHHLGDGEHAMRRVMVRCAEEDGEKDCEVTTDDGGAIEIGDFDCGGAEECRVEVRCDEGGCDCTANGDAVDCDTLPGFAERHGGP